MKHDLQGIFDALLEGVVVLDEAGEIDFLNSEAARILGASSEHLPGTPLEVVLGPDHPVNEIVERVRASGRASIHDEVEFPRRLAAPLPVDVSVSPIREGGGAATGVVIAIRDRSAARSLREEISERERQESYGHIAAGIAHEVKNPLGGIRGAAELMAMNAPDDRGRKRAQLIVDEVDRISGLVDELMIFARGDQLERTRVNIHQLLDSLLDLLELERGYEEIRIQRHYDPSLPEIEADAARLQQVFLNLARNALQAMEESGGTLVLSTRMTLEHRLVGADGRPRPTVAVSFADSGPGIPQRIRDRLTTPFFTTKRKGTGLGLSVARHWVRRHGGRMRIESTEGQGTRVHVYLPLEPLSKDEET
ncbi:MAG: PAS domain-containing protein [Deltaproteobacteria bacterium]|jgi:two-component system nitrogen regulation sensor histidine kinase GlnL|nr:PAS domain-containing protein [Deltaproteobacteria bacterium]MBW2498435.1 PAS domain-containing protein [Deltaproteobacteria bacterium]